MNKQRALQQSTNIFPNKTYPEEEYSYIKSMNCAELFPANDADKNVFALYPLESSDVE